METRAHHVIIGLFVVVAAGASLLFMLWLWQPTAERDYNYYVIGFTRQVSGLSVGGRVEYSGIRVGEVVALSLNPEDPRRVRATIRVDKETPVNVDTKADLALANISGAMKIQLSGGSPASQRIEGDADNPPLIIAESSSIAEVLETGQGLISGFNDLLVQLNQMFSDKNVQRFSQTLEHLEDTTGEFSRLSKESSAALTEISQLALNTNQALNEPGHGLLIQAAESVKALESASKLVEGLLARNEGALDQGLGSMGDLAPAMAELRSTLANLSAITRRLEENPSGFLFRGEALQEFDP